LPARLTTPIGLLARLLLATVLAALTSVLRAAFLAGLWHLFIGIVALRGVAAGHECLLLWWSGFGTARFRLGLRKLLFIGIP
jgi:hypothetical protein